MMPLSKSDSKCLGGSGSNNQRSNDHSSGSENTEDGQIKVVAQTKAASVTSSQPHAYREVDVVGPPENPSSEPLPDVSGVAATNKMSVPTESCLDVISGGFCINRSSAPSGSKASDVDAVSCKNTQNNLKRESENPNPAEEEGNESKRRRGGKEEALSLEEKMMHILDMPPPGISNVRAGISEFLEDIGVVVERKGMNTGMSGTPLDPGVLTTPTRPGGFHVSAHGHHIPEGPHAATSYDDMDTESEDGDDDGGTSDEADSNKAA